MDRYADIPPGFHAPVLINEGLRFVQDFTVLKNKHISTIKDKTIGPIKGQQGAIEEESRIGAGYRDPVRHSVNTKLHFIIRILVVKDHLNEQVRKVDALDLQIFAFAPSTPRRATGDRCGERSFRR